MFRIHRARTAAALVLTALLVPLLVALAPANADDPAPIPTTTRHFTTPAPSGAPAGSTTANARVRAATGVPKGTVTFVATTSGEVLATVPVDSTGLAKATVPCPAPGSPFCGQTHAVFHGTAGYGDSDSRDFVDGTVTMNPEPTIVKLGGPGLIKLYLTTAVTLTFPDGSPVEGAAITFTLLSPESNPGHGTPLLETPVVCTAWSDANGLASCGGQAAVSSIVSVLTGAWANRRFGLLNIESVKLPVVTVVK